MTAGTVINRYTDDDKQIIEMALSEHPDNRSQAFEQAAQALGRTPASISAWYYAQQKKKHGGNVKRKYQKRVGNGIPEGYELTPIVRSNSMPVLHQPATKPKRKLTGSISAFDIAVIAVEALTADEQKQLIRVMLNK